MFCPSPCCDNSDSDETSSSFEGTSQLISPRDPAMYFSEHNWHVDGSGVAKAVNPGAYFKIQFTGSSAVSLKLQPAGFKGWYMSLAYYINDLGMIEKKVHGDTRRIKLSSNLDMSATNTLTVYIYNSNQELNRWYPARPPLSALFLEGLLLDESAVVQRPKLRPTRALFFGDSITEGVNAQGEDPKGKQDWNLYANSSTKTYVQAVAAALDAEYSQVGFGSLGWTQKGGGDVPPFFTPGDNANSSWDKIFNGAPRTFHGLDYVVVLHGTNDGLRKDAGTAQLKEQLSASVRQWLPAIRKACGGTTRIFLTVPFGQFCAAGAPCNALKEAFDFYQGERPDPRTYFVDLGEKAATGLTKFAPQPPGTLQSVDGIHPRGGSGFVARHGELGAMLAGKMMAVLAVQH